MYPQFSPWGFHPWAPYPTGPVGYFQLGWIPPRPMFVPSIHEKRPRFNEEARSHDVIVIRGGQSPAHKADGRNYKGGQKRVWVPVKRTEAKPAASSEDSNMPHGQKLADDRASEVVE